MPLKLGSTDAALAVGSTAASKVYLGGTQVWAAPPAGTAAALLMHFDGSSGSSSFVDSSPNNATCTAYGSAQVSTTAPKYGSGALAISSASDRVIVSDASSGLFDFAGDFTIEAWIYLSSAASYRTIATRYNASNDAWVFRLDGDGSSMTHLAFYAGSATGAYYTFPFAFALNQWHHVAISRTGSSVTAYVDGAQVGSTQTNSGTINGGAAGTMIGSSDQGGYEFPFDGFIDDLRIVNGLGVYQCAFSPPAAALSSPVAVAECLPTVSLHYMVIGGGGSGGVRGGGGGAGGYREGTGYSVTVGQSIAVSVGGGGASVAPPAWYDQGNDGSPSTFGSITAAGGGGGGGLDSAGQLYTGGPNLLGRPGGSGGGGGVGWYAGGQGGSGNTPSTSPAQGYNGGAGVDFMNATWEAPGGGGGGANTGQAGGTNGPGVGGDGGPGAVTAINNGTPWAGATYAGGGGGGANPGYTAGTGGTGGGGNGAASGAAGDGSATTGGGGGGCSYNSGDSSGNGGSGFVAIRCPSSHAISVGPGLTYFSVSAGSDTIHCFTAGSDTIQFTS